ncbi:hypothetical protein ACOMHN_024076 [Nucella lapillus]
MIDNSNNSKRRRTLPFLAMDQLYFVVFSVEGSQTPRQNIDNAMEGNARALRLGDPGWIYRGRVPLPSNRFYVNRPTSSVEASPSKPSSKKKVGRYEQHVRNFKEKKKYVKGRRAITSVLRAGTWPFSVLWGSFFGVPVPKVSVVWGSFFSVPGPKVSVVWGSFFGVVWGSFFGVFVAANSQQVGC